MEFNNNILVISERKSDFERISNEINTHTTIYHLQFLSDYNEVQRYSISNILCVILDYALRKSDRQKILSHFNKSASKRPVIVYSSVYLDKMPDDIFQFGAVEFINLDKVSRLYYSIEKEHVKQQFQTDLLIVQKKYNNLEKSLEEKKHLMKQWMEAVAHPIFYKNVNGEYLEFNQEFSDFYGAGRSDILGKTVFNFLPKEQANFHFQKDQEILKNQEPQQYEFVTKHGNGTQVDVLIYKSPIFSQHKKLIGIVGHMLDISEIRAAKKSVNLSEDRYKLLSNVTTEGIIIHNNLITIDSNRSFEKIIGYNRDEIIGENLTKFVASPEDVKKIQQNTKLKKTLPYQVNVRKKDGTIITVEVEARIHYADDKYYRVVAVRDITEKLKNKEAVRESVQKYQRLVESLHEGMGIVDFNENIIFTNPAFKSIFGYKTTDKLEGKNLADFFPTGELKKIKQETLKRKAGKASKYNVKVKRKDGQIRHANISASPWHDKTGNISGSIVLIIDITQQVKYNAELVKRYDFEKKIFDISSRFLKADNFEQKVYDSMADIAALTAADRAYVVMINHKNKTFSIVNEWCKKGLPAIKNAYQDQDYSPFAWSLNVMAAREHLYIKDTWKMPKEARNFKAFLDENNVSSFIGFPIFIGVELEGIIAVHNPQKIKDYNNNEFIMLRNAGEVLRNTIQRKLADDQIKTLNDKLLIKNQELEQVLYVTSHDIRSPLVSIIGFTKELNIVIDELNEIIRHEPITPEDKKNVNQLITKDISEILKFINAGGVKIDKLLNGLLKLSRLGRTIIELTPVDVNAILNEIVLSFKFQIETHKISLDIADFPEIVTDRNLFSQILSNLIDNAIKYYDDKKKSYIHIKYRKEKDAHLIIIEDNGLGIPKDKQEAVFEIFSRLNPDKAAGEGLGLTIIKKGIEKLGGIIALNAEEGQGCTFTITLPEK